MYQTIRRICMLSVMIPLCGLMLKFNVIYQK